MASIIHQILQLSEQQIKSNIYQAQTEESESYRVSLLNQNQLIGKNYLQIVLYRILPPPTFKSLSKIQSKRYFALFMRRLATKYNKSQTQIFRSFGMLANENLNKNQTLDLQFRAMFSEVEDYMFQQKQNQQMEVSSMRSSCISQSQNQGQYEQYKFQSEKDGKKTLPKMIKFKKQEKETDFTQSKFQKSSKISNSSDVEDNNSEMNQFPGQQPGQYPGYQQIKIAHKGNLTVEQYVRFTQIVEYLIKLGSAQSQLTYICQQFGWDPPVLKQEVDDKQVPTFKCSCFIKVYNNYPIVVEKNKRKSKKKGRSLVAVLTLKKLYLENPQIWQKYQIIKKQKGLDVQKGENKSQEEKHFIGLYNLEKIVLFKPQNKKQLTQVDKYIQSVTNSKAEVNLLIQQCPGTISCPKPEKVADGNNNKWKLTVQLSITYKNKTQKIKKHWVDKSSKTAEQKALRQCLIDMYQKYPSILQKMAQIKKKKGIQT